MKCLKTKILTIKYFGTPGRLVTVIVTANRVLINQELKIQYTIHSSTSGLQRGKTSIYRAS